MTQTSKKIIVLISKQTKKWLTILLVLCLGLFLGYLIKPRLYNPYIAKLDSTNGKLLADGQKFFYADIDGDGDSEEFIYYHTSDNKHPIVNQNSADGEYEYTWQLEGAIVHNFDFTFGNYNNDSKNEIYVFSADQNGIYLYGIDGTTNNTFVLNKAKVFTFDEYNIEHNIIIHSSGLYDLNKDGYKEIVISINNRYSQNGSKVVAYDIKNMLLMESDEIGLHLVGKPNVFDIDGDGYYEIFLSTLNSINYISNTASLKSMSSKTIVLNHQLKNKFEPIQFKKRLSVSSAFPLKSDTDSCIVSLNYSLNKGKNGKLLLLNNKGKEKKAIKLYSESFVFDHSRNNWEEIITHNHNGKIIHYNSELAITKQIHVGDIISQVAYIDIDKDGNDELIVVKQNSIEIYPHDYSSKVKIYIPGIGAQKLKFSIKARKQTFNSLSVQNNNNLYLISYYPYKYYWTRYLFYLLSSIACLGLFILFRFLLQKHIEGIRRIERESTYMHIDLMKNQLDPHFVFNALNSIAYSVNKDDRKTAYKNLGIFSKFMREAIVSIDDFGRTLEDEINFVKYYLILEKFRFKEKFNYDIILSPEVSKSVKIPKMCIFSYVESALKKGVLPKENGGNIELKIDTLNNEYLVIVISDDGLHRKLKDEKNITRSMIVMDRSIKFYNNFNSSPIKVTFTDLGTPDNPKGSRVEIVMPIDFSYNET